ncbi:hypothetical protein [Amycolatopsis sp. NPDC050768]|uniref:hypothetical protein n=1 Tax=Amycolatopsis sp. NPDC050768 TaxID=3154839 RepID=UPI003403B00A
MGALEFISSLVSSLAWPVVVTTLVIALRKPIARLLTARPLKSLKAGPGGLELQYFDDKLAGAEAHIEEAEQPRAKPDQDGSQPGASFDEPGAIPDEVANLATTWPPAAVFVSFALVEKAIRDSAADLPDPAEQFGVRSPTSTIARKVLSEAEYAAFEDLRDLRNKVAHGLGDSGLVDASRARKYVRLANRLIAATSADFSEKSNPTSDQVS